MSGTNVIPGSVSEIPLIAAQQSFTITLNNQAITMTLRYADVNDPDDGGWFMDLADSQGNSILNGWPLVTGSNLFGQLNYLALLPPGFAIFVASDGQEPDAVPTYTNLGQQSHLYIYNPTSTT